ncbi:MAG: hypothetical protein LRY68_07990 [Sulfurospirillum sp.]|nr:hypothetical protein [Sulfurospirillum sp.]
MNDPEFQKISYCLDLDITRLMKEDDACLNIGINISKLTSLPKSQLSYIKPRIQNETLKRLISLMESENVYESALKSDTETFLSLYNGSITTYKLANFNQFPIPKEHLDRLSNHPRFNQLVYNTIQNEKLETMQKALLSVEPSLHVNSKSLFYLGLNALKYNEKKQSPCLF